MDEEEQIAKSNENAGTNNGILEAQAELDRILWGEEEVERGLFATTNCHGAEKCQIRQTIQADRYLFLDTVVFPMA